jgi:hypothetical protein
LNSCLCFEPVHCSGDAEDPHEGAGGLFVSSGDGTPFFQPRPQAFDAVAIVVDPGRTGDGRFIPFGRNGWSGAKRPDEFAKGVRSIAAVELRRLFPGISDNAKARECTRTIAGWQPLPVKPVKKPTVRPRG